MSALREESLFEDMPRGTVTELKQKLLDYLNPEVLPIPDRQDLIHDTHVSVPIVDTSTGEEIGALDISHRASSASSLTEEEIAGTIPDGYEVISRPNLGMKAPVLEVARFINTDKVGEGFERVITSLPEFVSKHYYFEAGRPIESENDFSGDALIGIMSCRLNAVRGVLGIGELELERAESAKSYSQISVIGWGTPLPHEALADVIFKVASKENALKLMVGNSDIETLRVYIELERFYELPVGSEGVFAQVNNRFYQLTFDFAV